MSSVVAVYVFNSYEQAEAANNRLWSQLSGGFERSGGYEIWINSSCSDVGLAGQICTAMGGRPR